MLLLLLLTVAASVRHQSAAKRPVRPLDYLVALVLQSPRVAVPLQQLGARRRPVVHLVQLQQLQLALTALVVAPVDLVLDAVPLLRGGDVRPARQLKSSEQLQSPLADVAWPRLLLVYPLRVGVQVRVVRIRAVGP